MEQTTLVRRVFVGLGLINLGAFVGILTVSSCGKGNPTDRIYETVTVNSHDMTYDLAFACRREEREKDLCIKVQNLESVWINKRDSWSVSYSKKPKEYQHLLLPQIQEQAWKMAEAEHYLRMYAEKEQQ